MAAEVNLESMSLDDKCNFLTEENKKLKIDLSSLQLSNRSLVNQNRDVKKKVMDYRLQITELEGRLKSLESIKTDFNESQAHCENLRAALDKSETKITDIEVRATQAEERVATRETQLTNQKNINKDLEVKLRNMTDDRDRLMNKSNRLEGELSEITSKLVRLTKVEEVLAEKSQLLEKLLNGEYKFEEKKCKSEEELKHDESGDVEEGEETGELKASDSDKSPLALVNDFFKAQEAKLTKELDEALAGRLEFETELRKIKTEFSLLQEKNGNSEKELEEVKEKYRNSQLKIKELQIIHKKAKDGSRVIGPSMPPWIGGKNRDDKNAKTTMEKLANADPGSLRTKIVELEGQVNELNNLLTYREDVILRIHEEISRKAAQLEQVEVERSALKAQVDIIKKELQGSTHIIGGDLSALTKSCLEAEKKYSEKKASIDTSLTENKSSENIPKGKSANTADLEAECERLRGKRDREHQRRKKLEAELDEIDKECAALKAQLKETQDNLAAQTQKLAKEVEQSEKVKLAELQSAVSQLRMDNEAKRCEMFDIKNKLEDKIAQCEKLHSEAKTKDSKITELETKLHQCEVELFESNRNLEAVRCRAVRGGPEVQRLQVELRSSLTTNKYLQTELDTLRSQLESELYKIDPHCFEKCKTLVPKPKKISKLSISNGDNAEEEQELIYKKLEETERQLTIFKAKCQIAERMTVEQSSNMAKLEQQVVKLQSDLASRKKRKKKDSDGHEGEPKKKKKSRFESHDDEEMETFCANCLKTRKKFIELESQLKAALEREASIRVQVKELKSAGGNAVEIQTQLTTCRRRLKMTIEASDRLLNSLGPSMYDDPAVLSLKEVLIEVKG